MSRVGPERRCLLPTPWWYPHCSTCHLASRFLRVDIHASMNHVQSSSLAYGIHSRNLPPCLCRKRDEERGGHAFGLMLERDAVWHRVGTRGESWQGFDHFVRSQRKVAAWAGSETTGIFLSASGTKSCLGFKKGFHAARTTLIARHNAVS